MDCNFCNGDDAVFWKDDRNNAFVDSVGEMLVTAHDRTIRFKVKHCPMCGRRFADERFLNLKNGDDSYYMRRPLWVQKLSDEKLRQMIEDINALEATGSTDKEYLRQIADTWYPWYPSRTGVERIMLMANDCFKEAAFRWM